MNLTRRAEGLRGALLATLIFLLLAAGAVFAGLFVTFVGSAAGYYALVYIGALVLVGVALYLLFNAREPVHRVVVMSVIALPLIGFTVPPRRFGISLLELVMFMLLVLVLWSRMWRLRGGPADDIRLFPASSLVWVLALLLPSVVFSLYPVISAATLLSNFVLYLLFIAFVHECCRAPSNDRLLRLLMYATLMLCAGVVVDRFTGLNLSLESFNPNQLSLQGGEVLTRARGFFGDPQKAAQFMACVVCFFTVLLVRGRFRHQPRSRALALLTVLASLAALVLTGSRGALVAVGLGLAVGGLLFNRWSAPVKLMSGLVVGLVAAVLLQLPLSTLTSVVPRGVAVRFTTVEQSAQDRMKIWFDTWRMFSDHPVQGIGLGSFRSYMAESSLVTRNFYGIGRRGGDIYIPDQPESGYFKILYEGGVLGSLASLVLLVATLARFAKVLRSPRVSDDKKTEAIAALTGLAVFAVTFVTLFTLSERRIVVLLALMMALIWAPTLQRPAAPAGPAAAPPRA